MRKREDGVRAETHGDGPAYSRGHMREVTFVSMPPIGPSLGPPQRGSLADLVMAIPYLVMREIPPRQVLNDVLTRGFSDAGMSGGCIWRPLEIDEGEHSELVQELQRRGTRPVSQGEPGGKPFDVPAVPPSIRTHGEWVVNRAKARGSITPDAARQLLENEQTRHPAADRYARWLDWLPVGDLYLAYLTNLAPEWEERPDGATPLPTELVELLRRLAGHYKALEGHSGATEQDESVHHAIREYVDQHGLSRWPYA